jgi:Family of unknown function (DUF5317)
MLRGGSLAGWARAHVAWWPVAFASLAAQLVLHNPPVDRQHWAIEFGPLIWVTCLSALLVVLVRNALAHREHRAAWTIAALGVGLNLLVVTANAGYMPQSADARQAVHGAPAQTTAESRLRNVMPMNESTQLGALGDVIPEPAWLPNANVVSLGDLLLGAGLAIWAFKVTSRKRLI